MSKEPHLDAADVAERPIHLSHIVATLKRYRIAIAVCLMTVALGYAIIAAAAYLLAHAQLTVSLPFLLAFKGADVGEYPNGMKFSIADITANPVLTEAYAANDLRPFVGFEEFSRSIYILESNRALEELTAEYQAKLSEAHLTSVDRERLEREFEGKRAGLSKSGYAIQFLVSNDTKRIPRSILNKTLNDILMAWARRAAIEKRALDYQVPVLSANILQQTDPRGGDLLIPLLLLRRRVDDVMANIGHISKMPGADLVRTKSGNSLTEVRLKLDAVNRFRLEPLINTARGTGQLGSLAAGVQVLERQLAYDERLLAGARLREQALREALLTYDSQATQASAPKTGGAAQQPSADSSSRSGASETVMPQLSETFLDRIVDMTKNSTDRVYRQGLNDEIKLATLATVPLEATVRYDAELINEFKKPAQPVAAGAAANLSREFDEVRGEIRSLIQEVNEVYILGSRQLNPATELYRVTQPPLYRIERSVSVPRLAVMGIVTLLIAIPLVIAGVLVHNRIREEEEAEDQEAVPHPATA